MKYRNKLIVEAVQFTKEMAEGNKPIPIGVVMGKRSLGPDGKFPEYANDGKYLINYSTCHRHYIRNFHDDLDVQIGDYIITGLNGDHFPCKPDVFAMTYEPAD